MRGYRKNLMGSMRSTFEIVQGFNVSLSPLSLALGGINFVLGRRLGGDTRLLKTLALANVVWLAAMLANSLMHWFAVPTTFLAAALACFAVSWARLSAAAVKPGRSPAATS